MIFVSVVADVAVVPLLPTLTREHGLSSLDTALLLSTTTFAMVVDHAAARPARRPRRRAAARRLRRRVRGAGLDRHGARGRPARAARRPDADRHRERDHLDGGRDDRRRAGAPGGRDGPRDRRGRRRACSSGRCSPACWRIASARGRRSPREPRSRCPSRSCSRSSAPTPVARSAPVPLAPAARGAHRNRIVVYAMLATVLLGFVGGMGNLLGSLRLSENGLSPSGIGVLFSIGALVWIAVAPLAGRMGEQRSHVALTAIGCALLGGAWLVPVADRSTRRDRGLPARLGAGRAGSTPSATCWPAAVRASAGAGRGSRDRPRQPELGRRRRDRAAGRQRSARPHRRARAVRRHRRALPGRRDAHAHGSRGGVARGVPVG